MPSYDFKSAQRMRRKRAIKTKAKLLKEAELAALEEANREKSFEEEEDERVRKERERARNRMKVRMKRQGLSPEARQKFLESLKNR